MGRHSTAGKVASFVVNLWSSQRSAQAGGPVIGLPSWEPTAKKRRNWKKEIKAERGRVIDEAVRVIREKQRDAPDAWQRGYNSAITTLEIMRNEK